MKTSGCKIDIHPTADLQSLAEGCSSDLRVHTGHMVTVFIKTKHELLYMDTSSAP
jgi:hypothetical protein